MSIENEILEFIEEIDEAIVISELNDDGSENTQFFNASIELFVGKKLKTEDFLLVSFIHEDDRKKYRKYISRLERKKEKSTTQLRVLNEETQSYIWTEIQGKVSVKQQGAMMLHQMLRNIDLRVQSENFLRQSEEKHRMLFTRANDAIFIINNMTIVDCNTKTLSMFQSPGYSGISGEKLYKFMPEIQPDGGDSVLNFHYLVQDALTNKPQFFYWNFNKFDGKQFDAEVSLSGFKLGTEDYVQVIVRDITARKKAEREEVRAQIAEQQNVELEKEIEERRRVEEEVRKARQYSESIINSSLDIIVACDKEGFVTEFNQAGCRLFGYEVEEVIGQPISVLYKNESDSIDQLKIIIENGYFLGEMPAVNKLGMFFSVYVSASKLIDDKGNTIGTVGVFKDITEIKKTEKQLQESIDQKEVLLKEVHHRVKNNLQVINSILKLQAGHIEDNKALTAINDCQDRIKSMAFIHESLYQSNDLAKVNFSEYIKTLCSNLQFSYQVDPNKVKLKLDVENISLSLDTGISCGLIVNELITNSLKYAFNERSSGEIKVSIVPIEEGHQLIVKDNGAGIPSNIDYRNSNSLGLQLVLGLVDQIDGKISLKNVKGTEFIINFRRL